ncbi:MAG TPA: hypothetical protein VF021_12585 [Longimicrobiales bacterium]
MNDCGILEGFDFMDDRIVHDQVSTKPIFEDDVVELERDPLLPFGNESAPRAMLPG